MSIEKKLTYLKDTKALIRKKLNRFGINVSSENTFRSYVDFLDEILNRYPKSRGQGTEVTLENTIEAQFTKFDVEGNSTQDGEPSPDNEVPILSSGDNENIWNGEIERGAINGDGLDVDAINRVRNVGYYELNKGTYTLSYKGAEQSVVYIFNANKVKVNNPSWENGKSTFTLEENGYIKYALKQSDNREMNVNDVSEIKLEKGNKATPYSPYGMGSINQKINNKNLCKITDFSKAVANVQIKAENNILSFNGTTNNTISANDAIWKNIKLEVKEKGVYAPSLEKSITGVAFGYYKENSSTLISPYSELEVGSYTLGIYVPANTAFNNFTTGAQIEKGSATPYVEHKEQDYSIFVQQPFRSIGDVRDLFFKNTVDSPYYDENLTLNGWYERHWIGEVVLNGTEEVYLYNDNGSRAVFYINVADLYDYTNSAETPELLSNRFRPVSQTATWEPGGIACRIGGRAIFFIFKTGTSVNEFKNWLSTHNVVVQYLLAEPLDLLCTEEQIQQIENKPSTYKDFTIIQSEDETPAYLEVAGLKED